MQDQGSAIENMDQDTRAAKSSSTSYVMVSTAKLADKLASLTLPL